MTAAEQAKQAGLKNLKQVTEMTGTRENTLRNWHRKRPALFRIVLAGCVAETAKAEEKAATRTSQVKIYTDYYELTIDGVLKVVEFTCLVSKHKEILTKLTYQKDDSKKLEILKSESESWIVHTPNRLKQSDVSG